jgi:hypothetical protein
MENTMALLNPDACRQSGAHDAALRLALEEARELAVQSRLFALNAAFEAIEASRAGDAAGELARITGDAGRSIEETERVAGIIETLLLQINESSRLAGSRATEIS